MYLYALSDISALKINYSRSYEYVPLPLPSRYRFGPYVTDRYRFRANVTQRYATLHQRYRPLQTVTDRYRILPLLALQALQALPIVI